MIGTIIEKVIRYLRNDSNYKLESVYNLREYYLIIFYRALQILRGLRIKLFINATGLVFCGRRVIVEHGYKIRSGASLILEDGVHINALSVHGVQFGRNVSLGKGVIIVCTGVVKSKGTGLQVGDNSGIGAYSYIGCQGGIRIGSDVIIGPGFMMFSENHNFLYKDIPIRLQGENRQGIVIGDNCWFGANVTVLDGVSVGSGCVVAAGTLLNKSIPSNSIVAGIPGKIIKQRTQ